ncbi:MAG: transglutaminase-like domain-containing protein [Clostridia bacterium]|nr:transglutaminase-like domain-containing protein [Clostridia bacterium]
MLITSDTTGSLYLKLMNFGDYNGSGWEEATEYDGYITVDGTEYSLSYLFSLALDEACYTASEVTVELYVDDYVLPYYLDFYGGDYEIQTSDVSYSGSTTTYTVNVYYYDYLTYVAAGLTLPEVYTELELAYRTFVYENYLSVPQSTAEYLNTVIQEQGFDADDENIVSKVVNYIQNAATYNLAYDSALDEEEDIVVAFLRDYKEGICQHYASAATLLFRTLGIPARYVLGYYAVTSAGQSVETGAPHAWTEIYIDGLGWVQLEVTGSSDGSGGGGSGGGGGANMELLQEIITIKIKPVDAVQTYDGSSLTASAVEGTSDNYTYMLRELLYLGYTYTVQFGGSQTELGTGVSYITSFVLYNPDGTIHDDSGYTYYIFEFSEGTLTVTDVPVVTVYLYDISKVYDGTSISYEDTDYYWLEDEYEVVVEGLSNISLTNYGIANKKMLSKLTVTVYDLYGNDVTDSVYVNIDRTDLLIVYRKCITITTASASKVYDGEPLTDETWWLSFGSIVEGQSLEVTVTCSITEVGFAFNLYDAVIYGANGATVTNNYLITYNVGILSVEEE